MFGKRRRAASNPPRTQQSPAPSPSASLAATKAFLKNQEANGALSSAAAAAALRSHTTAPTSVGDTVTKRMMRRGSLSSNASSAMPQRGGLERRTSSGSMTERSFRTGSPAGQIPPVPSVPESLRGGSAMHRRSSSLEPSARVASPGPRGRGRGLSLDRGAAVSAGRGQLPQSHLAQVNEDEHDDASPSVNFSRPMSSATKPSPPSSHGWFVGPVVDQDAVQRMVSTSPKPRPNTSSGVSAYQLYNAQQSVRNAADRPVTANHTAHSVEGAHLAGGSMRAKPSGTAVQSRSFLQPWTSPAPRIVDPKSPDAVYDPDTRRFIHKQDAMARHRRLNEEPEQPAQHYAAHHIANLHPQPIAQPLPQPQPQPQPQPSRHSASPIRQPMPRPATPPSSQSYVAQLMAREQHEDFVHDNTTHAVPSHESRELEGALESTLVSTSKDDTSISQDFGHTRSANERHLSPPRSAHFAPVAIELGAEMHQPLPRSSSPAKSSMKLSPSVSGRGTSPTTSSARFLSSKAASDASDTMSEDGSKKKKKTARVSFDEKPVVKSYSEPETPLAPPSFVPHSQDEFEDYMKPRPALPSFGSVRNTEPRRDQEDVPEKVTETVSTPMSTSVGSLGEPLASSNDFALGNIVAEDYAQKQADTSSKHHMLAPDLASAEGSGYVSDSSNYSQSTDGSAGIRKHGGSLEFSQQLSTAEPEVSTAPVSAASQTSEHVVHLPAIALLPATPSPREVPEPKYQSMAALGGSNNEVAKQEEKELDHAPLAFRDISLEEEHQTGIYSSRADTTDDDSSVYSDAYEDLSDVEGGFGSIDAVASSPVIPPSSGLFSSRHTDRSATDSPSKLRQGRAAEDDDSDITATPDWDATKQHWNGLNQIRKQPPLEEPAVEEQAHAAAVASRALQNSTEHKTKPVHHQITTEIAPRSSTSSQFSPSPSKPLKSALKKTTAPQPIPFPQPQSQMSTMGSTAPRQGPTAESHMRKTMRAGTATNTTSQGEHRMRKSMRTADSTPTPAIGLAASRHSMVSIETKEPRGALQKKHIPAVARPQGMIALAPKRAMAPAPTYDSDSDASVSSFQRERAQRRGMRNQGGQYMMRSSMRGSGPAPTMRTTAPGTVRSISPPGSPAPAFRKSMRSSSPAKDPTRSSRFSIRSLSPMGRFRNSRTDDIKLSSPAAPKRMGFAKQVTTNVPAATRSKTGRFADSSDEDDDQPRHFQSRFADSDSDEPVDYKLPPDLAPVRGIPKKQGTEDGDSTDLEEEAEDETPLPAKSKAVENGVTNNHVNGSANEKGTVLSTGSLYDSKHAPVLPTMTAGGTVKAKRSFFGLGARKKTSDPIASVSQLPSAQPDIPMPPQQRNRDRGLPLTPIDEDKDMNSSHLVSTPQSQKRSPKLQRRSTPEWPLQQQQHHHHHPIPPIPDDTRPLSSDGVAPRRPRFQNRRHSSYTSTVTAKTAPIADTSGRAVSYGRTGKKKKFQGLRRVFGLND